MTIAREVINYLGETIGIVSFDDDTPEDVIERQLAMYAEPPAPPPAETPTPRIDLSYSAVERDVITQMYAKLKELGLVQ